jgi:hypothetical protein
MNEEYSNRKRKPAEKQPARTPVNHNHLSQSKAPFTNRANWPVARETRSIMVRPNSESTPASRRNGKRVVHVVGASIMGLMAALEVALAFGEKVIVQLYDRTIGGNANSPMTAITRCQAVLWRSSILWALTRPESVRPIMSSARRLFDLARAGVHEHVESIIVLPDETQADLLDELIRLLDIPAKPMTCAAARAFVNTLAPPPDSRLYLTPDCPFDLTLLAGCLDNAARNAGVQFIRRQVHALKRNGDSIEGMVLDDGRRLKVSSGDFVIVCAGAASTTLLAGVGVTVPVRRFVSHLAVADTALECNVFQLGGGPTLTRHTLPNGRVVTVVGNSDRYVLSDGDLPTVNVHVVHSICAQAAALIGQNLVAEDAWTGVKTEVDFGPTGRSPLAYVAFALPNTIVAWPGKATESAYAAALVCDLLGVTMAEEYVGRSIWVQRPDLLN